MFNNSKDTINFGYDFDISENHKPLINRIHTELSKDGEFDLFGTDYDVLLRKAYLKQIEPTKLVSVISNKTGISSLESRCRMLEACGITILIKRIQNEEYYIRGKRNVG